MKYKAISINPKNPNQFIEIQQPTLYPNPYDLVVEVKAISVNPIDLKIRQEHQKTSLQYPRILGWDASGVVLTIGDQVENFKPGDHVFYAGELNRSGSNTTSQLVDSRITGYKPKTLSWGEAAVIPLTALTAWEGLFDRLHINDSDQNKTLLIIGGAGGVGSLAIPLAKLYSKVKVIATSSREESLKWCLNRGADLVINYKNMPVELKIHGLKYIDYIFCLNDIDSHWPAISEIISPQGQICTIVSNNHPLDLTVLKIKSAALHFEFIYTRSLFTTSDLSSQGDILNMISKNLDEKQLTSSLHTTLYGLNIDNILHAHKLIQNGHVCGKIGIVY
ncbi:zinc-binding alcohol dehydrogenase family protein [Candidatus Erwinia haradaeae]|uniref:Zinc-type alcohol dehydrogenase-like protein n=1 Tax=Candidatus Erwinia haradaeae TaxID=1922217 RepID=A0A451D7E0_9GAMM|nr:zinc-binding alcohol dehydrogenase family protein [Candidatus Erwinia haradaeae]VFP81716.1 Zinc-binding alcohol dehydrogenase family protein [Candidatus Erwinia haradaeae]